MRAYAATIGICAVITECEDVKTYTRRRLRQADGQIRYLSTRKALKMIEKAVSTIEEEVNIAECVLMDWYRRCEDLSRLSRIHVE
jgi:hypothetical protein